MISGSTGRWRAAWLLVGLAGLASLALLHSWMPAGPSTCLLYNVAGVACPGCGMTRATALLARGDIAASLHFHPLALPFAAQAAAAWCWWGLVLFGRVRVPSPWWGIIPLALDVVALAGTWLVRLVTGTLPA